MSSLPSKSRIALWMGIAKELDDHFGYRYMKGDGPCMYVIGELADRKLLANLLSTVFIEDFLEAMKTVRQGTTFRLFLRHETSRLSRALDLWWSDVDDVIAERKRDGLTDNVRQAYLDAALKTELFELDREALQLSYQRLSEALNQASKTSPEWGAMYLVLRIFEAALIHVARQHPTTREHIEETFVYEHDSSNDDVLLELAREQALASNKRWRLAIGLDEPETEAKILPFLRLVRGEKV